MTANNESSFDIDILVVDDMAISLKLLASILSDAGYHVRVASTGESALRCVYMRRPALILLDIKMPVMDGFEVCKQLKADPYVADIPIIFLSCLDDIEDSIYGFTLGAVDYITKPFHAQDILMRVRAHLALYAAKEQTRKQNIRLSQLNTRLTLEIAKRQEVEDTLKEHQIQLEELVIKRTTSLIKANEKYQALFNQARDGIVLLDANTAFIQDCNPEFERLCGRSLVELRKLQIWQLRPAEQVEASKALFKQVRELGYVESKESMFARPDGTVVPIECNAKMILLEQEQLVQAMVRDISERKRIEQAKQLSEERFHNLFNAMQEGFYLGEVLFDDADNPVTWKFLEVNSITLQMMGLAREVVVGQKVNDIFPQIDAIWLDAAIHTALTGEAQSFEGFGTKQQRHYNVHYYSPQRGQFACLFSDISERKHIEKVLRDNEARYARVLAGSDQGFWEWNLHTQHISVSQRFESILGYATGEWQFNVERWLESVHPEDSIKALNLIEQHKAGDGNTHEIELRCLTKTGDYKWILLRGQVVQYDEQGAAYLMSGTSTDIAERKRAEAQIWQQANYDVLTGLPNRNMFYDRLGIEIKKAQRKRSGFALFFIDLDKFKDVNDTLGHHQGDALLVQVAQRLLECVRQSDTVARLGGDEFTVILADLNTNNEGIDRVAELIIHTLEEAFYLGDEVAFVSASIGITVYPADSAHIDTLICNADQAMYSAKTAGRSRFHYFTPALQAVAQRRMQLINDLHHALQHNQFVIYYQPIVDLQTAKVLKAEALIRWQHPKQGLISPAEFIPLAEETGMIIKIGDWVFKEAARQVKYLRAHYHAEFQISINKSPMQFRNDNKLFAGWLPYLNELGLAGDSIVIEITEGLLLDAETNIIEKLYVFRDAGIQVALDDFGTGYCSLSYLRKFDIDYIKIDKSFVHNLGVDSNELVLCEAIIMMAHKLGLKVIAEGVSSQEQLDLLTAVGCDYGQGYLFAKPLPMNELELFLKQALGD